MIAFRILGRLILDSVAFFLAAIAAGATVYFGLQQVYALPSLPQDPVEAIIDSSLYAFTAMLLVGRFSWVIAIAAIAVAEVARIRNWVYFAAAGALCAAYALSSVALREGDAFGPVLQDALIFIAAGLAGGLLYWLVAGRSSGRGIRPE